MWTVQSVEEVTHPGEVLVDAVSDRQGQVVGAAGFPVQGLSQ